MSILPLLRARVLCPTASRSGGLVLHALCALSQRGIYLLPGLRRNEGDDGVQRRRMVLRELPEGKHQALLRRLREEAGGGGGDAAAQAYA